MRRNLELLLPLANPDFYKGTHLQITVKYDKGGQCLATYKTKGRGYYLSVGTIGIGTEKDGHNANCRCFGIFSHPTVLLEEANRLNQNRLEHLFEIVSSQIEARYGGAWTMAQKLLADEGRSIFDADYADLVRHNATEE